MAGRSGQKNQAAGAARRRSRGAGRRGGPRQVVVVESPAKAKTIGAWLGPPYRVMATRGHVRDLPSKAGSVVFVDLDREERAHLSLANDQIDAFVFKHSADDGERTRIREALSDLCGELRERVWVARVLAGDEWPVLIVCGADHAVSVTRLFRSVGVQSTIIHRDFDPDEYPWCR